VVSGGDGVCFWGGGIEEGMSQGDGLAILSDRACGDGLRGGAVCPSTSEAVGCQGEGLGDGATISSSASDNGASESGNVTSLDGPSSGDNGTIIRDSFNGTGD
jgi:hypothetical protein